jgi:hypothetical protein
MGQDPDGYAKAMAIFKELVPDRVDRLDGSRVANETMSSIQKALLHDARIDESTEKWAFDTAFHLSDWNEDAAFIVALHLFPERFTKEEIDDGVLQFALHAPEHVAEAARLLGHPIQKIFEDDDSKQ